VRVVFGLVLSVVLTLFYAVAIGYVLWTVVQDMAGRWERFGVVVGRVSGAVRPVWVRARFAVRVRVVLPVVWRVRAVRRVSSAWVRVVMCDVRRRWGFLRGASVLFAVCVPVWVARYQIRERAGAVSGWFRGWFAVRSASFNR
jgi:hypothetical protein